MPNEPQNREKQAGNAGFWFGVAVAAVGVAAIVPALRMAGGGLGNNADPGPAAFPIGLAIFLLAGGVWEALRAGFPSLNRPRRPCWRFAIPAVLLPIYAFAIGLLGFTPATLGFALGAVRMLGGNWRTAAITAVALVLVANVLFVWLFRVQLPTGILGFAW